MFVHFERQAQIKVETQVKVQVGALLFDKVFNVVLVEYSNYSNVFSSKNAVKLSEHTKIIDYAIKLKKSK